MEKVLDFMNITENGSVGPFPNAANPIRVSDFTYSAQRMGGAPLITAKVMYGECLDNVWNDSVFVKFNGERYFLKSTPTSSKSNVDHRYSHNVELVSERIILDNVYFYDVVNDSFNDYKPVTNSATVYFFGGVRDFVKRLNESLKYAKIGRTIDNPNGYEVVVDAEVTDEEKQITFENKFFTNVLQEIYNTFNVPYYFDGKTIHVGSSTENENLEKVIFEYGATNNLISVTKTNTNNKIVNRIAAEGSEDNIPYYYPNDTPFGKLDAQVNGTFSLNINQERFRNRVTLNDEFVYGDRVEIDINSQSDLSKMAPMGKDKDYLHYLFYATSNKVNSISITPSGNKDIIRFDIEIVKTDKTTAKTICSYSWTPNKGYATVNIPCEIERGDSVAYLINCIQYHAAPVNESSMKLEPLIRLNSVGWHKGDESVDLELFGISVVGIPENGNSIRIVQQEGSYIRPTRRLMPPIYRESLGGERFYNAVNGVYQNQNSHDAVRKILLDNGRELLFDNGKPIFFDSDSLYYFDNQYVGNNPKEHLEIFDDIKPTIKGITNSYLNRIDQFMEVAFDDDDNNEKEEKDGQLVYKHPYFYVKLHRFDGENGFNLFDCSIDESEMMINMTSGHCGACAFKIMVSDGKQENLLQITPDGNLKKEKGRAVFGAPQKEQNDTVNNNVWIALLKDDSTYGEQVMPDSKAYIPSTEDTFVITHILLPKGYILAAEERLKNAAIEFMAKNNSEIFSFSIKFSRIYLENHPDVLMSLNENSKLYVKYNGIQYALYVGSYTYKMSSNDILPEISVELKDSITIVKNAIQNAIGAVQQNVMLQIAAMDIVGTVTPYFISKRDDDNVDGSLTFNKRQKMNGGASFGEKSFIDGNGNAELESLIIRSSLTTMELVFNRISAVEGDMILTEIDTIEEVFKTSENTYQLVLQKKWNGYFTAMVAGNVVKGVINTLSAGQGTFKTCWMRVNSVNVSNNRIDVTLYNDEDTPGGKNYPPMEMMKIARMGNQSDIDRQRSLYISNKEARITFLDHVSSPTISDKNYQLVLGRLPEMQATKKLGLVDKVGLFSQAVLCEKLFRIDWNGDLTTQPVDRGVWVPNPSSPYRFIQRGETVLEQHRVTYRGCTYACMKDMTKEEPSWETTDWALVEGDDRYEMEVHSSNGVQFVIPDIDTEISFSITYANMDITQSVLNRPDTQVTWKRNLPGSWSPTEIKKGVIRLQSKDMGAGWGEQYNDVSFSCDVEFSKGNEKIKIRRVF